MEQYRCVGMGLQSEGQYEITKVSEKPRKIKKTKRGSTNTRTVMDS